MRLSVTVDTAKLSDASPGSSGVSDNNTVALLCGDNTYYRRILSVLYELFFIIIDIIHKNLYAGYLLALI